MGTPESKDLHVGVALGVSLNFEGELTVDCLYMSAWPQVRSEHYLSPKQVPELLTPHRNNWVDDRRLRMRRTAR